LITIGMIGTGSHGTGWNLKHYLMYPELCRVVAVCNVSRSRAENAQNLVNNTYKSKDCKIYQDFRELLEDNSIDAVQISTPDHWHVPISIMAALKGKHVCCKKPTLTIDEGRLLCEPGHRLSTLLHCGNIALKLNRKVEWDPVNESFVNDPAAEKFRKREMREKWSYNKICPEFKY
ncbi:MAG: Gfo/Idh/MocA family oxidoreductase, partial [Bacteroidales bacterium]|nr:Gfo/Idh/MocA family oxidoreductase [Bacteroidales bacterium]